MVRFEEKWLGSCFTDFAYHIMLRGDIPDGVLDEIPEAIRQGHPSVKVFTTDVTPSRRGRKVSFGDLAAILRQVARAGGILLVHAEDDEIVMDNYRRMAAEGRVGFEFVHEIHSSLSEELAFARVIRLAEHVEGATLYFVHVSSAAGVDVIRESRSRGYQIYGETLHQYALLTSEDYRRPNGQMYHTYPSLKTEADCAELWRGMADGTIGSIGTDGIYTSLEDKIRGKRSDDVTGGSAGVEPRMSIIYTEGVEQRGFSLQRFVDLTSANAAKYFGLYPRKGALSPGSDADITILDPARARQLRAADLHGFDYSPWEGFHVAVWPAVTLLAGKQVVVGDQFLGDPTDGRSLRGSGVRSLWGRSGGYAKRHAARDNDACRALRQRRETLQ